VRELEFGLRKPENHYSRKGAKAPSDKPKACHPERMRGIQERFLPLVEMTGRGLCKLGDLAGDKFGDPRITWLGN